MTVQGASQPGWLPPVLASEQALRPRDAALVGLQTARVERGLSAAGADYPRRRWWGWGVLPIGVADAVAVAALVATDSVAAGAAVAGLSAAAVGIAVAIRRDPLRISTTVRLQLSAARVWRSANDWVPPASETPERARLARAQQAVQRIAATTWWARDLAADAPLGPDLAAELDGVDAQAWRLAGLASDAPARAELRALLDERVKALEALATELERQDTQATGLPVLREPPLDAVVGGVLDQDATDRIRALTQAIRESPSG